MRRRLPSPRSVLLVAIAAALITFFLLVPWRGVDTQPPVCWSLLDREVPCGQGFAFGVALGVALLVTLGGAVMRRRSGPQA